MKEPINLMVKTFLAFYAQKRCYHVALAKSFNFCNELNTVATFIFNIYKFIKQT